MVQSRHARQRGVAMKGDSAAYCQQAPKPWDTHAQRSNSASIPSHLSLAADDADRSSSRACVAVGRSRGSWSTHLHHQAVHAHSTGQSRATLVREPPQAIFQVPTLACEPAP